MLDKDFFSRYNEEFAAKEKQGIPGFQMNRPVVTAKFPGRIGLELEIEARSQTPTDGHLEDVISPDTKARWTTVRDGSLRGDYAKEYILTKPCNRNELPFMLNTLFERFKGLKTRVDNSNRCSTHVHLNMSGKRVNEITAIICLWNMLEESLIKYCGEQRVQNHFAISSLESRDTLQAWEDYLRHGHTHWDRNLKYSSLNVLPLWDKGSIEIRCGAAADEASGPIQWATLLDVLVDYACDNYSYLPQMGADLSERGGVQIFEAICTKEEVLAPLFAKVLEEAGGADPFNDQCLRGFRNCQGLVFGFPWEKWKTLIEKEYIPDPFAKPAPKTARGARVRIPIAPPPIRPVREWGEAIEQPAPNPGFRPDGRPARRPDEDIHAFATRVHQYERDLRNRAEAARPLNVGDRVAYIQGTTYRHGTLGTVERIEPEAFGGGNKYFVRWDAQAPGAMLYWLYRHQLGDVPDDFEEEFPEDLDFIDEEEDDEDDD